MDKNSILGALGVLVVHHTLREAATRLHPDFMQRPGINPYLFTSFKLTQQPPRIKILGL
ncbi:hypothetical protein [Fischerella thermalis]|uniref:hypothetical protein n=1 Tax=Fischerella thermalis TaxID=372787 RepID=UPI0015E06174|nr:hypothetical protein [Fischerella thermalis]